MPLCTACGVFYMSTHDDCLGTFDVCICAGCGKLRPRTGAHACVAPRPAARPPSLSAAALPPSASTSTGSPSTGVPPAPGPTGRLRAERRLRPDMPDPRRLNNVELERLLDEHHAYNTGRPAPDLFSVRYIAAGVSELELREQIETAGAERAGQMGRIPRPSAADIAGARYIMHALRNAPGESGVVSVGSRADGKLVVAFSGERAKVELTRALVAGRIGDIFVFAPDQNDVFMIYEAITKAQSYGNAVVKVCAEPKLMADGEQYTGVTTLWVGSRVNPWPLLPGRTGFGTPMLPCTVCVSGSVNRLFVGKPLHRRGRGGGSAAANTGASPDQTH